MITDDRLRAGKLDVLQRVGAPPAVPADVATTAAPVDCRRLTRITSIGCLDKEWKPSARRPDDLAPADDLIVALYGHRLRHAFLLQHSGSELTLQMGVWQPGDDAPESAALDAQQRSLEAIIAGIHPAAIFRPAGDVTMAAWPRAGVVTGIPTVREQHERDGSTAIDRLLRAMSGERWASLVLAEPVSAEELARRRHLVIDDMRRAQAGGQATGGPSPLAEHYTELLKLLLKDLTAAQAVGGWRTAVYLLGTESSFPRLAAVWTGVFSGPRSVVEPIRVHDTSHAARWALKWALPDVEGSELIPWQFQSLLSSSQLAAYVQLPQKETAGWTIRLVPEFDAAVPEAAIARPVTIGAVTQHARPTEHQYAVDRDSLAKHAFVAGVTGGGKTNTIFHLLQQLTAAHVPFLVIEPAKTEYRALLQSEVGSALRVFTVGNESVMPLRVNPFEAVAGTPVAVHLDLLRSVFAAGFGMWTPLPQILERCLYKIYAEAGWDLASDVNRRLPPSCSAEERALAFPTLSDLVEAVDEVTRALGYEDKIAGDLRAALHTRLDSLRAGSKGTMLDVRSSTPMQELLQFPTVIELERLGDDDDKAFLIGLLLIRLVEQRRADGQMKDLRHLLVIEEAHRLLSAPAAKGQEEADPRGKAVETFGNLLSEIRAYGQGVLIADQVPSKLAPAVVKNTTLKIVHRIVSQDDRGIMAGAMNMSERQARALATLGTGEAVVFAEGDDAPILVKVPQMKGWRSSEWPADAAIAERMALLNRGASAPPAGAEVATAAAEARRLVESASIQRLLDRILTSALVNERTLPMLWPDVREAIDGMRRAWIDPALLMRSVAGRAAASWAARRGRARSLGYLATERLAATLREALLALCDGDRARSASAFTTFRAAWLDELRGQARAAACCAVLGAEGPCLFRDAAAELAAGGQWLAGWIEQRSDVARLRSYCDDAAYTMIALPGADWTDDEARRGRDAYRHAALAFASEMLIAHGAYLPHDARELLRTLAE